jgi:hypothetical protein
LDRTVRQKPLISKEQNMFDEIKNEIKNGTYKLKPINNNNNENDLENVEEIDKLEELEELEKQFEIQFNIK